MDLVNSFMMLKAEESFDCKEHIINYLNHEFMEVTLNSRGYGRFFWGKGPASWEGYNIPILLVDKRMIICFTSTPQNVTKFKKFLFENYSVVFNEIRLPFDFHGKLEEKDVVNFKVDPIVGVTFILKNDEFNNLLVSSCTDGITSFSVTNSEVAIRRIISLILHLIYTKGALF